MTMHMEVVPHEEWEDHSYIVQSYSGSPIAMNSMKYGPIPNVLLPEIEHELGQIFNRSIDDTINKMMKLYE